VIKSFSDKESEKIWKGNMSKKFPTSIQNVARRKLRMINNSINIADLKIPPSNRLEKLKAKLKGMYSIRINEKYRIIFNWKTSNAYDVEIIDYHD
jgi:proteic killer suppression protein